ncbi:MAG: hypothetical protein GC193_10020 [Cryomorphaceae bacterium]|nr:hypothetical protein [Cryomorphaceae bacterium]
MKENNDLFNNFGHFNDKGVMLAFRGDISSPMLDGLLDVAERKLTLMGCATGTRKRAFHILVECLQNLQKHSTAKKDEPGNGVVIMVSTPEGIRIATGNAVPKDIYPELQSRIDQLNDLEPEKRKKEYQDQLVNGKISDVGGAGLGFIDIARKSGNELEYSFSPMDEERLFFCFNVKVS